jgi:hypothetical protein
LSATRPYPVDRPGRGGSMPGGPWSRFVPFPTTVFTHFPLLTVVANAVLLVRPVQQHIAEVLRKLLNRV